ncbi:MAG: ATP-binding cassette domain-containing protein [Erysipelotrichaceae bacterium]|nr:ATP-binding cassette domain-containing protein [Erysipelotrichaceae bacterium]
MKNINFSYSDNKIIINSEIRIPNVGFISIFGQSGVGKTTLLKIIINQLEVSNMKVIETIDRNEIFYVDQFATLYNNMKIVDHFKLVSEVYCTDYDKSKIIEILKNVGLDYINENKLVKTLSVGERKRLSIALAISVNPRLLVIDEPTSSIDYDTKLSLMNLLKDISKDRCVLITSHETDFNNLFDMIYRIEDCKIIKEKESHISVLMKQYDKRNIIPNLKQISKYKSKKDKKSLFILFVVIVIILNIISYRQIALYFNSQTANALTESMTDNSLYFVFENIDKDLLPSDWIYMSYYETDGITDNEAIESMSDIDHVLEVKPYYQLCTTGYYTRYQDIDAYASNVKIYNSNGHMINSLLLDGNGSQTPAVVPYYKNQNITINGEKLDGNYIDETTAEQFGLYDINFEYPIIISLEVGMPICTLYRNDQVTYYENNVPQDITYAVNFYDTLYDKKEITIQIDGILSESDYTNYYNTNNYGSIYVNYEELNQMVKDNLSTDIREEAITLYDDLNETIIDYIPSNYIVLVDSVDNLDEVGSNVESLNSKILTFTPYAYVNEIADLKTANFTNNIILTIVYALIALIVIIIMLYRYNIGQKSKIILYQNLGLNKNEIHKIFEYDIQKILLPFIIVNIVLLIFQMMYEGILYSIEQWFVIMTFVVMSFVVAGMIYCINKLILKKVIHE